MSHAHRKRRSRFRFQVRDKDVNDDTRGAQPAEGGEKNANEGHTTSISCSFSADLSGNASFSLRGEHVSVDGEGEDDRQGASGGDLFMDEPVDTDEVGVDAISLLPDGSGVAGLLNTEAEPSISEQDSDGTSRLKIWNWRVLWGLLMTNGSQKLTKYQYQAMRMIADAFWRLPRVGSGTRTLESSADDDLRLERASISCLPHYTTLASKIRSALFDSLAVRCSDTFERVDTSKAGARATTYSADGVPQVSVRTVLPSEYARSDLATGPVLDILKSTSLAAHRSSGAGSLAAINVEECVDIWPIVAAREYFYGLPRSISVDSEGWRADGTGSLHAEVDDVIQVCILGQSDLCQELSTAFKHGLNRDGHARLRGTITSLWTVHHCCRYGTGLEQPIFGACAEDRDHHLGRILEFAAYRSPSDSVTVDVPERPLENEEEEDDDLEDDGLPRHKKKKTSPEMTEFRRQRKEAMRERRLQMDQAWAGWKKPVVKPGDIVCLLRPCETRCSEETELHRLSAGSRLAVVHRFWTENEERDRHVFWVPGNKNLEESISGLSTESDHALTSGKTRIRDGRHPEQLCSPISNSSPGLSRDITSCKLWKAHSGPRGPQHFQPVSSMGRLESGEEYFIYRFLLFWDGFEVAKGKSASGDGVYMVCLNLPLQARAASNAVRIISLCPPGVKSSAVFARIQNDIVKGMTDGFIDIDACGRQRRIFLDLVGCIGDTPALNAALDTLGHTANACCHLCKFTRRCSGLFGSRYTSQDHFGLKSSSGRGYYQHLAMRDCDAGPESSRLLGMKPDAGSMDLPLHSLRQAMLEARPRIPTTCDGTPLLSGYLDPYKSCFVAPDHLLTGHFRDCVNMAFKLLPSKQYRQSTEAYMIGFLKDCDLPAQNRLFDMGKKGLYSMSMTELYALSVVAEHGFRKACAAEELTHDSRHRPSRHCQEAIAIVGSASRLIASLWRLPCRNNDSAAMVASFNCDSGMRHLSGLQKMVSAHVGRLQSICSMNDEDVLELEGRSISRARKSELSKLRLSCLVSRRCVDKPNVHRLLELAYSTLPMVGHISRVGELSLEKAHQSLKRAIQQSNNKDIQIHSMSSAIFNDWQARLTMLVDNAVSGDDRAILGCYRLLVGRESVIEKHGRLTAVEKILVRRAFGPSCCVPSFLAAERKSVISPRFSLPTDLACSWVLRGSLSSFTMTQFPTTEPRSQVYDAFRDAGLLDNAISIEMGDSIRATSKNGIPLLSLAAGDVVEVLVYRHSDTSFHIPFVVHRQSAGEEMEGVAEEPAMWAVVVFVRRHLQNDDQDAWAALRPCQKASSASTESDFHGHSGRFQVGTTISFVEIRLQTLLKAAVLHDCSPHICRPTAQGAELSHGARRVLEAPGAFYAQGREQGYPPRKG